MSRKKRDNAWSENGFEDWGGYMAAKKAKLEEQFRNTASKECEESSNLFKGIAIFVNGYTDPTSDELRRLMMMHGGIYHHYMRPKVTTHIIASNLPYSKIILYRKSQNPIPICKPQWITDSVAAGKILNFQDYLLYSNSSNIQPQLAYKLNDKKKKENNTDSVIHNKQDVKDALVNTVNNETNVNNGYITKHNAVKDELDCNVISTNQFLNTKTSAQSTKDPEFLSTFYSNSRLHYIATMGTIFKDYVNNLRDKSDRIFPGLERITKLKRIGNVPTSNDCESDSEDEAICFADNDKMRSNGEPIIMHIDMDCFFVSVGIRNKSELQDLPVAVTHAKGNKFSTNYDDKNDFGSLSEIASCSYAARKAGVKNGMFLGQALKLCPNLKTIQYDFEGYKEVSYILYDTVASYTLDIEAVSCDEMYADCTRILEASKLSPLEFASIIRREIKEKTGCPVSTGFGNNKLQARLATRKAKPDNQFYLSSQDIKIIRTFDIRDLPGVGRTTMHALHKMSVHTCEDLQKISLGILQKEFGKKTGKQLYKMCRGLDDTKLNLEHIRKSVSAEINYGIRFQSNDDAIDFLSKLSAEVCNRLIAVHAKGKCITLKLMIRAEEAPKETMKFMGHGPCNYITKSKNLIAAIDDVNIIKKEVISIWNQLHLIPEDMRGIGIQISRLETCRTKQNKFNLINFFDKKMKKQTCDKMLENNDNRCNSNCSGTSKQNNLEVSPIIESLGTKNISVAKINNLPLECAQFSESTIPDFQDKLSTLAIETENDRLFKGSKNIAGATDTLGKSNKKATKRQTSQENFFKHTKPCSGKTSKYEIPPIQEIDMSILIELPDDIRNEIFDEYKRSKKQLQTAVDTVSTVGAINKVSHNEKQNWNVQNCLQIDSDISSTLHPNAQLDMQMYSDMERKMNKRNFKEINEKDNNKQLQRINGCSETCGESIVNGPCTNKVLAHIPQANVILNVRDQLYEEDDIDKTKLCQVNRTKILHNNAAMNKADTFILQNLSILHNNENIDKYQEMLINLVNHLFTLPLQQVRKQIQMWVIKSKVVNEVDFLSLATFLSMLPQKKRIEDLHILLKTMHRCTMKTGNCIWHKTYRKIVKHVQRYMQIEYNNNLIVPSIRCDDSKCN